MAAADEESRPLRQPREWWDPPYWEANELPWQERAPVNRTFNRRRRQLVANGLVARLTPMLGTNTEQPRRLVGLRVEPVGHGALTFQPANRLNHWHITVAYTPVDPVLLREFMHAWRNQPPVHLRFDYVNDRGYAQLAPNDPVVNEPTVRALNRRHGPRRDGELIALHISF